MLATFRDLGPHQCVGFFAASGPVRLDVPEAASTAPCPSTKAEPPKVGGIKLQLCAPGMATPTLTASQPMPARPPSGQSSISFPTLVMPCGGPTPGRLLDPGSSPPSGYVVDATRRPWPTRARTS